MRELMISMVCDRGYSANRVHATRGNAGREFRLHKKKIRRFTPLAHMHISSRRSP
jgi:hypothetical protein